MGESLGLRRGLLDDQRQTKERGLLMCYEIRLSVWTLQIASLHLLYSRIKGYSLNQRSYVGCMPTHMHTDAIEVQSPAKQDSRTDFSKWVDKMLPTNFKSRTLETSANPSDVALFVRAFKFRRHSCLL